LLKRAPAQGGGLSDQKIAELLQPLRRAKGLLLAVSGGPDSTALLIMAARWAGAGDCPPIDVATVDHGLRPEAAAEAQAVADHARRRGLKHHLIAWPGAKPISRLQERAREARYRLLAECAAAIGADHVVTAHHADDQAETILFRLLRGSGVGGLRGMEPLALRDAVAVARPLLQLRKSDLVAYCQDAREAFVEDPANRDPRFARTRLRRLAAMLADEGLGPDEIGRLGRRAARMEETAHRAAAAASARLNGWSRGDPGLARAFLEEPEEVRLRLLREAVGEAGGRDLAAIRLSQLEMLNEALLRSAEQGEAFQATLGGAMVRRTEGGAVTIARAPPRRNQANGAMFSSKSS
jgi:tRNA(Ile)-lysidine synthase